MIHNENRHKQEIFLNVSAYILSFSFQQSGGIMKELEAKVNEISKVSFLVLSSFRISRIINLANRPDRMDGPENGFADDRKLTLNWL